MPNRHIGPARIVALVALAAAAACSARNTGSESVESVGSNTAAIQGGTYNTTSTYAVGMHRNSSNGSYTCSGTLLTPNLVLTARHCVAQMSQKSGQGVDCSVDKFGAVYSASSLEFTTSATFSAADSSNNWVKGSKVYTPNETGACGYDVALVLLSKSFTNALVAKPGIEKYLTDPSLYTPYYTAIGFGGTSPSGGTSGTRYVLDKKEIACLRGSSLLDCWAKGYDMPANRIVESEFIGGDGVCGGDSGGGAYEYTSVQNGTPIVVGVAARAGEDNGKCVSSMYERVDQHRNLIITAVTEAAAAGSYAVPAWALGPAPVDGGVLPIPDGSTPVKDAGKDASKDASVVPDGSTPSKKAFGESCGGNDECETALCASESDELGFICTLDCSADTDCPESSVCRNTMCVPGTPAPSTPAVVTTTTTTGCSMADPSKPVPWRGTASILVAAAIAAVVRRTRRTK